MTEIPNTATPSTPELLARSAMAIEDAQFYRQSLAKLVAPDVDFHVTQARATLEAMRYLLEQLADDYGRDDTIDRLAEQADLLDGAITAAVAR